MTIQETWVGDNDKRLKLTGQELDDFNSVRNQIKTERETQEAAIAELKAATLAKLGVTAEELAAALS